MERVAEEQWSSYRQAIFRFIRRRTRDEQLAEDLTQEVLADAIASLDRFDPGDATPFLAWLYTIARRRLADQARTASRGNFTVPMDRIAEPEAPHGYGRSVGRAISDATLRLDGEARELLTLRLIRGYSFAELSSRLDVSDAAVRMRYMRALRSLRSELERGGFEP